MATPRLGAPELVSAQATPETTVNEIVRYVEQGAGLWIVKDKDIDDPPGSPAQGDAYIVHTASPTGAWSGWGGRLAFYANTAWEDVTPIEGTFAYVQDENKLYLYNGSAWAEFTATAANPVEFLEYAVSDETTALTTGTGKITFRMPYAFTLSAVRASVTTAPTGSTLIVDINEGGSTILSTKLSIDASEKTSTTAASAAVISDTALADDAEITIDIDQIGSTIAGAGLKVKLIGSRT
jgi:hypothetical protein